MVIRVLGILMGLAALGLALFGPAKIPSDERLGFLCGGAAFLAYGLGGHRLLAKIAPQLSEPVGGTGAAKERSLPVIRTAPAPPRGIRKS